MNKSKNKFIVLVVFASLIFTSCGIFKERCRCPKFSDVAKPHIKDAQKS
jgi:hypothetical protein